nr:16S rRNA (cytidine(1402)-2'-O)-methyltransferase [Propionibacterium sp.]
MNADPTPGEGLLVLAATPIGDLEDASPALARELRRAGLIAAEDTRRLKALAARLGVSLSAPVVSYFDGNEASRVGALLDALAEGRRVLVVTDAGMPLVSDPGYRVVTAALERGYRVTAVPGPSAALTALALSGLPSDRFCFEGFLPRKSGERSRRLASLAREERTMVFFEAPHRLAAFLTDAAAQLGADRPAAVCRELTKTYEEVRRGGLAELAAWASGGVLGEITVVIGGAPRVEASLDDAAAEVLARVGEGVRFKEAVATVAVEAGVSRGVLYEAALAARKAGATP